MSITKHFKNALNNIMTETLSKLEKDITLLSRVGIYLYRIHLNPI